ncbi:4-(cytidine 5'-diphospho)-2-C-methyl-D-erythritol kinase [Desulfovibrio sp.]|uniref:4-(cytidine 5'-diphospho)-2-C-methyl-D-erythritol kinase n=1 Tax=Desulfovibrio sp. TaxID=885 RepID=UPI0023C4C449|nr:4-(cytidine 5'-diphospho)-2-C-methyl-D-erythritol kinase [Desulfovibrio sp.]MDE7241330.1 4-(cytidine 5'-diphospho)-2-C-methyl-D-erythritol kinase [Desulfovibrio sp.]
MTRLRAGCKVNLGLRILGRRPDGYHELDSVFWPLPEPCDDIFIRERQKPGISVVCDAPGIDPARNTLTTAHAAFAALAGGAPGLEVRLVKRIPSGAGLGGGRSDAAALLLWLNSLLPEPLPHEKLTRAAVAVGADVPFFLNPRPSRVGGIGEVAEPLAGTLPPLFLVLVCPDIHVATGEAFGRLDELRAADAPPGAAGAPQNSLTKAARAANGNRLIGAARLDLANDLEAAVFPRHPQLAELKARLRGLGALAASMSGSGSSVFGLFAAQAAARDAAARLRGQYPRVYCQALGNAGM